MSDPNICLNCNKPVRLLKSGCYSKWCSFSCQVSYRNKIQWRDPNYRKLQSIRLSKLLSDTNLRLWSTEKHQKKMNEAISNANKRNWSNQEYRNRMTKVLMDNCKLPRNSGISSKCEDKLLRLISLAFPGLEVIKQYSVLTYHIDFYLPKYKLGLEVDGEWCHDIYSDIERDKRIYEETGILIRRLDSEFVAHYLYMSNLIFLLLTEFTIKVPYYKRIPTTELLYWKWSWIAAIGPIKLLTYEVING